MRDTAHDELVSNGAEEESDEHGNWLGEVDFRREVYMSPEEVVDGDVPFAGEFEPIFEIRIDCPNRLKTVSERKKRTSRMNSTSPSKISDQRTE